MCLVHAVDGGEVCGEKKRRGAVEIDGDLPVLLAVDQVGDGSGHARLHGLQGRRSLRLFEGAWKVRASRVRGGEIGLLDDVSALDGDLGLRKLEQACERLPRLGFHGVGVLGVSISGSGAVRRSVYSGHSQVLAITR